MASNTTFKKLWNGLTIVPSGTTTATAFAGDVDFSSNNKLNLNNGTTSSPFVTEAHAATLTNKSISGSSNTITNIPYGALVLTGSIVDADISTSAAISFSKLAPLTSAHLLVGSAGNVASSVVLSGDATISNSGVLTIGANKVTSSKISSGAATVNQALVADGAGNSSWGTPAVGSPVHAVSSVFTQRITGTEVDVTGATVTLTPTGSRMKVGLTNDVGGASSTVYIQISNPSGGTIEASGFFVLYRSNDGGSTWTSISDCEVASNIIAAGSTSSINVFQLPPGSITFEDSTFTPGLSTMYKLTAAYDGSDTTSVFRGLYINTCKLSAYQLY